MTPEPACQYHRANGVTVSNSYDLLNRLSARALANSGTERFGYATNGLVAYTNQDAKVTRYARDAAGRLLAITNANLESPFRLRRAQSPDQSCGWTQPHQHSGAYNQYGWLTNKTDATGREICVTPMDVDGR